MGNATADRVRGQATANGRAETARASKVERVVYTGSTSIYGNPRSIPINEDDYLVPLSPYAVSKLGGEHYVVAFYESYGLPTAAVRYAFVPPSIVRLEPVM